MRIQILRANVPNEYGQPMALNSIQTGLSFGYSKSLVQQRLASDLDGFLMDLATVTDLNPPTTMSDYSPYGYGNRTQQLHINTPSGGTLNSLVAAGRLDRTDTGTVQIINSSTANTLTVNHLGAGTAGNQFLCMSGGAVTILPYSSAFATRDNGFWRFG